MKAMRSALGVLAMGLSVMALPAAAQVSADKAAELGERYGAKIYDYSGYEDLLGSGEIDAVRLVGPMAPATQRGREGSFAVTMSAASRASRAPCRFSS